MDLLLGPRPHKGERLMTDVKPDLRINGTEIERKFLVNLDAGWCPDPARGVRIRQGYLSGDPARVVRVRIAGESATLTIKGPTFRLSRPEFEYPIPVADAAAMLDMLCEKPLIEKIRYTEWFAGHCWEVDLFEGANTGLVVAEVEVPTEETAISIPYWIGQEVSGEPRYFNSNLMQWPFASWPDHA